MSLFSTLFLLITLAFVGMVFLSFYFRVKVLASYRELLRNRVAFGAADVFDSNKLEREIIPRYPGQAQAIRDFARYLRKAIRMASVLIVLITLLGALLMYFRE